MALFSFRHSVKTFSEKRTVASRAAMPGQTAAHLRYITRPSAARVVLRERISGETDKAAACEAEKAAQKRRGRVCERFVVALPVEASAAQREALVRAFAERLTGGVAGYVAAIHDQKGNDARNPHFHLVAFDAHERTRGRGRPRSVLGMARKGAVQGAAQVWAAVHNQMMTSWGFGPEAMVSHLSFHERGIDRVPTIHEGAGSRAVSAGGKPPKGGPSWRRIDEGVDRRGIRTPSEG